MMNKVHENIKLIKLTGATETEMIRYKMDFLDLKNASVIEMLREATDAGQAMVEYALRHENLMDIVKSEEKFDLFMYDVYYNDALLG